MFQQRFWNFENCGVGPRWDWYSAFHKNFQIPLEKQAGL